MEKKLWEVFMKKKLQKIIFFNSWIDKKDFIKSVSTFHRIEVTGMILKLN